MTHWPTIADIEGISPHQREQLAIATANPVGLLGGNPGTGKSYSTAAIIREVVKRHGSHNVAVGCPTGKAAVRITEAMQANGIEDITATTIHRMLGVNRNGHDGKGWGFMFNAQCQLRKKFVFIDESSMLDCQLTSSLISALPAGTHLLFIGDFAQLPPVGHGAPLRDMIDSGRVPYGELTEIHRNAGAVVRACADLKAGRPFQPSPKLDLAAGENLVHFQCSAPWQQVGKLKALMQNVPAEFDPKWDVQVLCAVNANSPVGREHLNAMLQEILNPLKPGDVSPPKQNQKFRRGDKVICLSNGMLPVWKCPNPLCEGRWDELQMAGAATISCAKCFDDFKPSDLTDDFCANGEIGEVIAISEAQILVSFASPRRVLRAVGENRQKFDLAYAITCHKSQGSQWPVVIIMADDSQGADFVTSWEWWRTGLSRMEKICFTIGKLSTIHRQCKKSALKERKTFLTSLLQERIPA